MPIKAFDLAPAVRPFVAWLGIFKARGVYAHLPGGSSATPPLVRRLDSEGACVARASRVYSQPLNWIGCNALFFSLSRRCKILPCANAATSLRRIFFHVLGRRVIDDIGVHQSLVFRVSSANRKKWIKITSQGSLRSIDDGLVLTK